MDDKETYVLDNVEVKLTGRKAHNKLRSGRVEELVEVTPVDSVVGIWKKWVRHDNLFTVDNQ